jgi:hypothetical protein
MAYSLNALLTVADCNLAIAIATKDKEVLEVRKTNLVQHQKNHATHSVETSSELQAVNLELDALEAFLPTLPDGSQGKRENLVRKERLDVQKLALEKRDGLYNKQTLLQKELELARCEKELEAVNDFMVQLDDRKAELS